MTETIKFLQISLIRNKVFWDIFNNKIISDEDILESALDKALSWIHYNNYDWIIKTTKDANVWYACLKPYLNKNDQIIILEINPLSLPVGQMPKMFYEWFKTNI